jgi:hypothetical protein
MPWKDKNVRKEHMRKNWKNYNHTTPYVYSIEFPDGAIYYGHSKQRYRFGQRTVPLQSCLSVRT